MNSKELIKSVIKGAVMGAFVGGLHRSWLGPAGTVLGVVGGAIKGGVYAAIADIGYQSIKCSLKGRKKIINSSYYHLILLNDNMMSLNK